MESAIEQAALNLGTTVQCAAVVQEEENHEQASIDVLQSLIQPSDYIYRISSANSSLRYYLCKVTSKGNYSILVDENGKAFKGTVMQVAANVDPPVGYPTVVVEASITDDTNFTINSGSMTYAFADNRGTPTPSSWYAEADLN